MLFGPGPGIVWPIGPIGPGPHLGPLAKLNPGPDPFGPESQTEFVPGQTHLDPMLSLFISNSAENKK